MSRVMFYDPFLDIAGGGEKVLLTVLEEVARSGRHDVVMMSPTRPDLDVWRRLGVDVDPRRLRWRRAGNLTATPQSAGADLLVVLVNHFPPLSLARRSAAIVQFPFARLQKGRGPYEALRAIERRHRLDSYDTLVCYSEFVAEEIRTRLEIPDPVVIPPPVDLPEATGAAAAKERRVLAVGRFFPAADANNKKHDVLIEAWRALESDPVAAAWELHLVGGLHDDPASHAHFEQLRDRARGAAIAFHPNASAQELADLYRRSALFWHATGFGETRPERFEHFGITTVEAMAYGCVPVVIALGGQREIVSDGANGRLWGTVEDLVFMTAGLMADPASVERLARAARASAERYGKANFVRAARAAILEPAGV